MGVSSHHCAKALTKRCCWMTGMSPPDSAAGAEPVFVTLLEHGPASPSRSVQAAPAFVPKSPGGLCMTEIFMDFT